MRKGGERQEAEKKKLEEEREAEKKTKSLVRLYDPELTVIQGRASATVRLRRLTRHTNGRR
jgi:hypothetical protein